MGMQERIENETCIGMENEILPPLCRTFHHLFSRVPIIRRVLYRGNREPAFSLSQLIRLALTQFTQKLRQSRVLTAFVQPTQAGCL